MFKMVILVGKYGACVYYIDMLSIKVFATSHIQYVIVS